MDDFRNHVWEDTSFNSDEAERPAQSIDCLRRLDDLLRDGAGAGIAASGAGPSIKIGSRVWRIGETITSIGATAVCKSKLRESFGDRWAQASVTGILLGKGANKKIRVRWTNLKRAEDMEYGCNHRIFANASSAVCLKGHISAVMSQLATGAGAAVSKSFEDLQLAVASPSTGQSASKTRLEEMNSCDQIGIHAAFKNTEARDIAQTGTKRKPKLYDAEQGQNKMKKRPKCSHGKQKAKCKECGGSAFCSHGKQKRKCKECGGSAFCSHGKQKSECKECGGSAFCSHGKLKAMQRVPGLGNLQPRQIQGSMQSVRRLGILQPRQTKG